MKTFNLLFFVTLLIGQAVLASNVIWKQVNNKILMTAISSLILSSSAFATSLTEFSCESERNQSLNISLLDGSPRFGQQASGSYETGQNQEGIARRLHHEISPDGGGSI